MTNNYNYLDTNKNAIYTNYGYKNCGSYVRDTYATYDQKTNNTISYMEKIAKIRKSL